MLEVTSIQITSLALVITAVGGLWGLFKVITSGTEAARLAGLTAVESLRKEMQAEIEKIEAVTSKNVHDKANAAAVLIGKLEVDLDRLKRETVRREDMAAIESRLVAMFTKIETKFDGVADKLAMLGPLEKQLQNLDSRVDGLIRRIGQVDK